LPEFTGERVVPGLVDANLLNEHLARYRFAARFARGRRVLDAGCGTGYGSAELAREAAEVTAVDLSAEAVEYARERYAAPNLTFQTGDCLSLPDGPFDLIVAFEVIEHLAEWPKFLLEARRVLAPEGIFLVSTPNRLYYTESRGTSGENPFHVHEFEYEEYRARLEEHFPHVAILLQNHVEGVAFASAAGGAWDAEADGAGAKPASSHFFLGVCSARPLPAISSFVWVPATGNILREREHHIRLLADEVEKKTGWLNRSREELDERNSEFEELLERVRVLDAQVEERNRWALAARELAEERGRRIVELQEEFRRQQARHLEIAQEFEAKLEELEEVNRAKSEWALEREQQLADTQRHALETEQRLTADLNGRIEALAKCVAKLDEVEETVIERTLWAQGLERELAEAREQLAERIARLKELQAYRWVRTGVRLGLVPEV
jgi:SAM-dependent methyltransferase